MADLAVLETTPDGRTLYALDLDTGDVLSYWPTGRPPKGAERRLLEEPRALARQRVYSLRLWDGSRKTRTHRSLIADALTSMWADEYNTWCPEDK